MKNYILTTFLAFGIAISSYAQFDITPTYGYNFGAKASVYGGELKMKGSGTFGIKADFFIDNETSINFIYTSTPTTMSIRDWSSTGNGGISVAFSDVIANYFMIGGARYFDMGGMIQPYTNFNIGGAYYSFQNINPNYRLTNNEFLRFAVGFGLGSKIMFSNRIGLDVHIRALAPISWGGIGVGIGTGGVSSGAYVGSTFISGDVGGGIIIRLGE